MRPNQWGQSHQETVPGTLPVGMAVAVANGVIDPLGAIAYGLIDLAASNATYTDAVTGQQSTGWEAVGNHILDVVIPPAR